MSPPIEVRWLWRRIYTYAATLLNSIGLTAIIWRLDDPSALRWLGLALIGAYLLAGELSRSENIEAGLARYEQLMRPVVDATPPVKMSMLRRANPSTSAGIRTLHAGARVLATSAGQTAMDLLGKRFSTGLDTVQLPDYPQAAATPAPA